MQAWGQGPSSIEDVHLLQNKSKKNWEKARERFAENFLKLNLKDGPGTVLWVKGTVEEVSVIEHN